MAGYFKCLYKLSMEEDYGRTKNLWLHEGIQQGAE